MTLRTVTPADAQALLDIYEPYVKNTAISFEYVPPTVEEFAARIEDVRSKFPYLAAVDHGKILGYAYAHPYGVRKAYDWSAELSIYLAPESRGKGIGRRLYEAMEVLLQAQNVTNLYVLVASVDVEDEYLTHDSLKFHTAMGYTMVGKLNKAGYKFGRWYDMVTMEKHIADHPPLQPEVVPWLELADEVWMAAGVQSGVRLTEPTPSYAQQLMDYKAAFLATGDSMDGTGGLDKAADFDAWYADWQRKLHEDTVPEGLVPATTYLAVDERDRVVGMIDIRHRLNDWLLQFGGHIGYSVAPHCRRRGYAVEMLRLALDKCRDMGLQRVLVTCDDGNTGSAKTIEYNGGVLENITDNGIRRYWIEVCQ